MQPRKIRKRRAKKFRFALIRVYLKIVFRYVKRFTVILCLCSICAIILVFLTSLITKKVPNFLNSFENSIVEKVVTNIKEETLDEETIESLKETYINKIKKEKEDLNQRAKNH